MVRTGTRIFYQSITEATGTVAPFSSVPVYFAVTGSPDGSRNALSPKNDFMIMLQRVEAVTTVSAASPAAQTAPWPPQFTSPTNSAVSQLSPPNSTLLNPALAGAPGTPPVQPLWPQPSPPPAAPVQVLPAPPVFQTPAPVRPTPFAYPSPAPYPTVAAWPAASERSFAANSPPHGQPLRSGRSFDLDGGIIGISIHIGCSSP